VRERDFVLVSVSTIDVVEADGELRYDFESTLSGGEDFGVDGIAEGGDQAIDAGLHFLDDQAFRRSLRTGIDLHFVSFVAENVDGISDVAGGEDSGGFHAGIFHAGISVPQRFAETPLAAPSFSG